MPDPNELREEQVTRLEMAIAGQAHIERFGMKIDRYDWLNDSDEWSAAELRAFRDEITMLLSRAADLIEGAVGDDETTPAVAFAPEGEADDV